MAISKGLKGQIERHLNEDGGPHKWSPVWLRGSDTPVSDSKVRISANKFAEQHQLEQAAAGVHVNVRVRKVKELGPNHYMVESQPAFCARCSGDKGTLPPPPRTTAVPRTEGRPSAQYRVMTVKEKNRMGRLVEGRETLPPPVDRSAVQSKVQTERYAAKRADAMAKRAARDAARGNTPKKP